MNPLVAGYSLLRTLTRYYEIDTVDDHVLCEFPLPFPYVSFLFPRSKERFPPFLALFYKENCISGISPARVEYLALSPTIVIRPISILLSILIRVPYRDRSE